jgi:hypothetical protein
MGSKGLETDSNAKYHRIQGALPMTFQSGRSELDETIWK